MRHRLNLAVARVSLQLPKRAPWHLEPLGGRHARKQQQQKEQEQQLNVLPHVPVGLSAVLMGCGVNR